MADFAQKWNASPFDETDPRDRRSESARKILIKAALASMNNLDVKGGEDMQDIAGGFLVGLVNIMASMMEPTDENHSSLCAGLLQLVPWAIDVSRSLDGLPPLPKVS
jgi:hypothetical protein